MAKTEQNIPIRRTDSGSIDYACYDRRARQSRAQTALNMAKKLIRGKIASREKDPMIIEVCQR